MQPEGDDLNPYAAPQSDVTPLKAPETPMPRPASTKWLLGLMWLFAVCTALMLSRQYLAEGPPFLKHYDLSRVVWVSSLMVISLIAFHAFKRSRITYALGILYLLFLGYGVLSKAYAPYQRVFAIWKYEGIKTLIHHDVIIALLFVALVLKFCYQFIFGLPSRRFYRMTQK